MLLLFIISLLLSAASSHAACTPLDQTSLLSFSLNFPQHFNWSSSSGVNCCDWDSGIGCNLNHQVISLSFPSIGLRGPFPSSILNLTSLLHLDLSHNSLSASLPDALFSSLNALLTIDLSYNLLTGSLPDTSPAINLLSLNLSSNHFNGTIRVSSFRSNLISFNVSNNTFAGPIPNPASICTNSPFLALLDFSFNDFSGDIPQGFGRCSNLQALRAGFNNLTEKFPADIYSSGELEELFLAGNHLSGGIDGGIANLTNLKILSLFGNELTGSIPSDIGKFSNLEQLLLHINQFSGTLPSSLSTCTNLRILNLRVNKLEGALSDFDFSKFLRLKTFDLGDNNFTGPLPPTLFNCKSLTAIRLANNKLRGDIPPEVIQLQSLSFLSLSYNGITNITGALENLMGLKNLSVLILSKNTLQNPNILHSWSPQTPYCKWEGILCLNNRVIKLVLPSLSLQGPISPSIFNISALVFLDLSSALLQQSYYPPSLFPYRKCFFVFILLSSYSSFSIT